MTDYKVTVHPDGSIDATWASPAPGIPDAREAAILDRDSVAAITLRAVLTALVAGAR